MKILTIAVPCYNSQDYIRRCIDSLLPGGDDVEILIVNDGSSDQTAAIAEEYQQKYPGIVRAIHQPNGGHGSAVNTGIANATGFFFKVVDSDDWVDANAYQKVLQTLLELHSGSPPDMMVSNYVYEKEGKKNKTVMQYRGALPKNRLLTWDEVGSFKKGQYILMHSIIYRTALLKECGLRLPKHTFYVDNLYAYIPLKDVQTLYYLDVDLYRYLIGRDDQSVQESRMIRQIDQQLLVNRLMVEWLDLASIQEPTKRGYLFNYLEIVTTVTSILLIRSNTKENTRKKQMFWQFIKEHDEKLYRQLRRGFLGRLVNLPGKAGAGISVGIYKLMQKLIGFN